MNEKNRTRMLWAMAAMVIVYALVNVIVYFVSGSFGVGWFVASLAVYGLVLVAALLLLARDRTAEREAARGTNATTRVEVQEAEAPPIVSVREPAKAPHKDDAGA